MRLDKISQYRSELMGFAIIIVMLFHVSLPQSSPWFGLRRMGNLGVDIFFFLSGIGLWYSWTKSQYTSPLLSTRFKHFYFNRALRIYPAWLLIAGYYYISHFSLGHPRYALPFGGTGDLKIDSIIDLFGEVFFNWDFWLHDELTFWYVPATMMMYLFAPLYMQLLHRNRAFQWLVVLPLMWCIIMMYVTPIHHAVGHLEIFWSRIPVFMLGINCAEAVRTKQQLDKSTWWMVIIFFIISLGACVWLEQYRHGRFPLYTERMLYIVLAITTILIMAEVFDWWYKVKERMMSSFSFPFSIAFRTSSKAHFPFVKWVGGISLEIYLFHIQFVLVPLEKLHLGYWPTFLLMTLISLPVAWVISRICSYIINNVRKVI